MAAVLTCRTGGAAVGLGLGPETARPADLQLRSDVASITLPGWTRAASASPDLARLTAATARSARAPEGVTATVGALRPEEEPPALGDGGRPTGGRLLRLAAVTVRETTRRDATGDSVVTETRATTGATLAAICRGRDQLGVARTCRTVAVRLRPRGSADLAAGADRTFLLTVRDALRQASGSRRTRTRLAGGDADLRRAAAALLAASGRAAAAALDVVHATRSQRMFAERLAAGLRARSSALESVAGAFAPGAERSAARGIRSAQARLDAVIAGGRR
jgi:hypothetical protein